MDRVVEAGSRVSGRGGREGEGRQETSLSLLQNLDDVILPDVVWGQYVGQYRGLSSTWERYIRRSSTWEHYIRRRSTWVQYIRTSSTWGQYNSRGSAILASSQR
jgi:hypothetical protein